MKRILQNKQYQFLACVILAIVLLIIMSSCSFNQNSSVPKNTIVDKEYNIYGYAYEYIDNDGDWVTFYEKTDKYNIGDKLNIPEKTK